MMCVFVRLCLWGRMSKVCVCVCVLMDWKGPYMRIYTHIHTTHIHMNPHGVPRSWGLGETNDSKGSSMLSRQVGVPPLPFPSVAGLSCSRVVLRCGWVNQWGRIACAERLLQR